MWNERRACAGLLLALCAALAPAASRAQPSDSLRSEAAQLIFLDVGQGDAIVIRSPEGKVALVDAGPGVDLVERLRRYGIDTIDVAIATHPHADHIGGMARVVRSMPVRYYMDNGVPHSTTVYLELLRALRRSDVTYLEATQRTIQLGSVVLRVLPPLSGASEPNDRSVGLVVEFGSFRAILTGDSQVEELNYFISLGVPEVTLLKAAHHGSRNGLTPAWLAATKPEVVVISCGSGNPYAHPDPWALRYYRTVASSVYRTDLDGEVTVTAYADGRYDVSTRLARGGADRRAESRTGQVDEPEGAAGELSLWVFADAPGNDHYNLNGEYAVISNAGSAEVKIGGWTLCDAAQHCYTFPPEATIGAGARAVVYTGAGRSDGARYYMNSRRAVWNNKGDRAILRDAAGRIVVAYEY